MLRNSCAMVNSGWGKIECNAPVKNKEEKIIFVTLEPITKSEAVMMIIITSSVSFFRRILFYFPH